MGSLSDVDFKVGEWWVRPQFGELEKGGTTIQVERRSMDVLCCLVRHSPRVVSKEQILLEVWGDAFVGEEVISHAVSELRRKVFDDNARDPRYIRTVPRKGYCLVAEVHRPLGAGEPEPGVRIGPYKIEEKLGSGAMGVVYKAFDRVLQRTVALKFLAPDLSRDETARKRFQREARLTARLDHPNVATVHGTDETIEGRLYIVTSFYDGGSLKERLQRGRVEVEEGLEIAIQIARGLAEAQRHNIIHRDVKPANVLLTETGTAKLVDFGIAKLANSTRLTRTGGSLGTPAYKSPEQSRGDKVDHRTDVWSFGVVLYEMFTGRKPFRGDFEQAVVRSILEDEPATLRDAAGQELPTEVERVVRRALKKDPDDRYQTVDELVEDLEKISEEAGNARREPTVSKMRRRFVFGALVLALTLGSLLVSWFSERRSVRAPKGTADEVSRLLSEGLYFERRMGNSSKNLENAEGRFRRALALEPDNPEVKARLALALCRSQIQFQEVGRLEEAHQLVSEVLITGPDSWLTWLAQAKLKLLEKKFEEATHAARKAIDLTPDRDPDSFRGHALLGEALIELGQVDKGLESLRRAVRTDFGFVRARLVLALNLWRIGRLDDAIVHYNRILEEYNSNHMEALTNLGFLYEQTGQYGRALPLLKKAFDAERDPRTANILGAIYFNLRRWQDAIDMFHEAKRLDPSLPYPYVGLGDVYQTLDHPEEATHWYERALENYDLALDAGGAPLRRYAQRAVCAAKLGRFEEAIAQIQNVLRVNPKLIASYAARIYALAGDRENLYRYLRQAVREVNSLEVFRMDPSFKAFQDDPQFRAILEGGPPL